MKEFRTERFSVIVSAIFVFGRAILAARFFVPFTWASAVFGCSELSVLLMSLRNLCVAQVDKSYLGIVLPFCYMVALLLRQTQSPTHWASILLVLSFMLIFIRLHMGTKITCGVAAFTSVLRRGIYSKIRHPLVLAELLLVFSFVLTFPSCWNISISFVVLPAIVSSILIEERFLFGKPEYRIYSEKVPWRLIPWIW